MTQLKTSSVTFNPVPHTYTTKDGHSLSGVTSLLERQLFSHKYDNIPQYVLDRAAEHGTAVHQRVQLCDTLGVVPEDDPLIEAYNAFKDRYGVKAIANEYLVSDNVNVASCIDVVFDDFSLCDIKTTSKLDYEYLSWQLSVYAYLFEFQNPGLIVPRLFAMWMPKERYGQPMMTEIDRIPACECARLIEMDSMGQQYVPSEAGLVKAKASSLSVRSEVVASVIDFERQIKALTDQRDELKRGLLELMKNAGISKWTSEDGELTLSIRKGGERATVDATRFKAEQPKLYEKYLKRSKTADSLAIQVKDKAS